MSVAPIRINKIGSTQIQVEETGVNVHVRNEVHAYANHYIEQSRSFFPSTKLRTYIDCPKFLRLALVLWFASWLGFIRMWLAVVFFLVCVTFFIIYCQHEWVNQKFVPVVLKQPLIAAQESPNQFYEVTVTELNGMALENYRAGVGFVQLTQGKIQFQAFNNVATKRITSAKVTSRVMLAGFLLTSVVNVLYMVGDVKVQFSLF